MPAHPSKDHKLRAKAQRHLLERGPFNKMLAALPALHEEAFAAIDCLACANCCRNYSPRFKQPDIRRIAKRLKIKEGELVSRYLYLDEDNDYVVKTKPCPFLDQSDNTCTIYEDRPSDCHRYPYTDEDVFLKRVPLTMKNVEVCPIASRVMDGLVERFGS